MQRPSRDPATAEVFISYRTWETSTDAQQLFRLLEERGLSVFLDAAGIRAGDRWNDKINAALTSPNLTVGIVLMSPLWFENFLKSDESTKSEKWVELAGLSEKPDIVVWEEVRKLRARGGLTIMPVVVRTSKSGETPPSLPAADRPGHGELKELHDYFGEIHYEWVALKGMTRFDDVVAAVFGVVRDSALARPLRDGSSLTAEQTPPLPLSLLHAEPTTRRALMHYAEIASEYSDDHGLQTILGQEALLRPDFPAALERLQAARDRAPRAEPPRTVEAARAQLWHAHALNLFVLASFRGGRPRRLQITEASALLRALFDALKVEIELTGWAPGSDEQAAADRESAAHVMETTLLLLWLLWKDFFLARNVRFPEAIQSRQAEVEQHLEVVRSLLRHLDPGWAELTHVDADLRFLAGGPYLDGLPPELKTDGAWRHAKQIGDANKLLQRLEA